MGDADAAAAAAAVDGYTTENALHILRRSTVFSIWSRKRRCGIATLRVCVELPGPDHHISEMRQLNRLKHEASARTSRVCLNLFIRSSKVSR